MLIEPEPSEVQFDILYYLSCTSVLWVQTERTTLLLSIFYSETSLSSAVAVQQHAFFAHGEKPLMGNVERIGSHGPISTIHLDSSTIYVGIKFFCRAIPVPREAEL